MYNLKNINDLTKTFLNKTIVLLIKYANEKDIERMLFNCFDVLNLGKEIMCNYMEDALQKNI